MSHHKISFGKRTTLPQAGPGSVFLQKPSPITMTRRDINELLTVVFGPSKTSYESQFINRILLNGAFSLQIFLMFLITFWFIFLNFVNWHTFIFRNPIEVRCRISALEDNFDFHEVLNISLKEKTVGYSNAVSIQYCHYDDRNYTELAKRFNYNYTLIMQFITNDTTPYPKKKCEKHVSTCLYPLTKKCQQNYFSVFEQYEVYCDQAYLLNFVWIIATYGICVSAIPLGIVSDIHGRKIAFLISSLILVLGNLISYLPSYWLLLFGRFLVGVGSYCCFLAVYILFSELCNTTCRLHLGFLVFFAAPLADFFRIWIHETNHWRYNLLTQTALLLVIPFALWYLSESPRWLLLRGDSVRAWKCLQEYGYTENPHPDEMLAPNTPRPSIRRVMKLFLKPKFRERILTNIGLFFLSGITNYSDERTAVHALSSGVNMYTLIFATGEATALMCVYVCLIILGRKRANFTLFGLLTLFNAILFLRDQTYVTSYTISVLMIIELTLSKSVYFLLIFHIIELYPTRSRGTAVGIGSTAYGIAFIVHYHLHNHLTNRIATYLPLFVSSVLCMLLVCFLHETANMDLPDVPREALSPKILISFLATSEAV